MSDPKDKKYSELYKNKSSLSDAILGRVRTDKADSYYENLQTKVSNQLSNNTTMYTFIKKLYSIYGKIFGPFHVLPDFLILGSGRCGTTSLVELYLRSNSNIMPSNNNEIFFFDIHYNKSLNWYRLFFPTYLKKFFRKISGKKTLVCDATGNYFFHPYAPKRIKKILPNVKLILMMRNPVERTISQYRTQVRHGIQHLPFEEVLENEHNLFEKEFQQFLENGYLERDVDTKISIVARSRYSEALERWLEYFDKSHFLFLNSDEYFKNPLKVYNRVLSFLELPPETPTITGKRGIVPPGAYKNIHLNDETRNNLKNYFEPWNNKLFNLIGEQFDWK
tara:strand:+ start:2266 stop:3270 length:1005 start_codon:yes stop_codon:yes gene_type:complete